MSKKVGEKPSEMLMRVRRRSTMRSGMDFWLYRKHHQISRAGHNVDAKRWKFAAHCVLARQIARSTSSVVHCK